MASREFVVKDCGGRLLAFGANLQFSSCRSGRSETAGA